MNDEVHIIKYVSSKDNNRLVLTKSISYIILSTVFFIIAVHLLVILYDESVLKEYTNKNFTRIETVTFQAARSFNALELHAISDGCTKSDRSFFKKVISKYYYIGDIGIIKNGRTRCSIFNYEHDNLTPNKLKKITDNQIYTFNFHSNNHSFAYRELAFIKSKFVIFVSRAYLNEIDSVGATKEGSGSVIYNVSSKKIYRIFGDIDKIQALRSMEHTPSFIDYIPYNSHFITIRKCSQFLNICQISVDTKLGLFRLSNAVILIIVAIGMIFGIIFSYIYWLRNTGIRKFFKRLKQAIKSDQISVVYQPQYDFDLQRYSGVEALARWKSKEYGYVPPDIFIKVCEMKQNIMELTKNVISRSFCQMSDILEANPDFTLSINISSSVFTEHSFIRFVVDEIRPYKFKNEQIIFEVTERTSSEKQGMIAACEWIKAEKFRISIDDFGTGFSNLSWLSVLEPDEIKIDKMFTQAISDCTVNNYALEGIIRMLEGLNIDKVFEGIETDEQYSLLKQRIPDAKGQGWLFSKAITSDELSLFLNDSEKHCD